MISKSDEANNLFPVEEDDGIVCMEGNKIISKGKFQVYDFEITIDEIQLVYVTVSGNKKSFLFLLSSDQNLLPTHYKGFEIIYQILSTRFNFNNNIFFETIRRADKAKKELWRKLKEPTYWILNDHFQDYGKGFEIQSPQKEFIDWNTTYIELATNPFVFFTEARYGIQICTFKYPVRIGNILLKEFGCSYTKSRRDVPIGVYFSNCVHILNSDKSYYELKEKFKNDFAPENHLFGYERADQNSFGFRADDMIIGLVYSYDSETHYDVGSTFFRIENHREYPELLLDKPYERDIAVSNYIFLSENIQTSHDYKRIARIKRRPHGLLTDHEKLPVIWLDRKNNKIGFADATHCQVYAIDEIDSFTIQNILPAKGGGLSYLIINFKDNSRGYNIFNGPCYAFNPFKEQIISLTGLEVRMAVEGSDC